jgi:hypothetical protein
MPTNKARADLWMDLALVAFLIGLDVVARLVPHAPGFMPIAASALFAGRVLRLPALAIVVPIVAMGLSALVGIVSRRWPGIAATAAVMVPCSLVFFALSNFAVWAFSGMYSLDFAGLTQCYVAALPFLQNTVAGDLFWTAVLFGGAWAMQNGAALSGRAH